MAKRNSTQREKLQAKEATILAAAHAEFAELGFEKSKMAQIARRARIAEGTVYLYYRNKAELLEAVVADFWQNLTGGARRVVLESDPTLNQFTRLAQYHLVQVMADFDFVGLTSQVRRYSRREDTSLLPIRSYVRVFDEIFDRGVTRGEIHSDCVRWQWRDLFYGQLEYSARTLILRGSDDIQGVLDLLRCLLEKNLFVWPEDGKAREDTPTERDTTVEHSLQQINQRLAAIESKLPS